MILFILKRLAIAIPTLLVLIILSFILMKVAPGNPFTGEKNLPRDVLNNIYARYGLDKPMWADGSATRARKSAVGLNILVV